MSTKNGLLRGPKFNGRHTTVIEPAERVVRAASADDSVSKIVVGLIRPMKGGRSGQRRIKFKGVPAGLEVSVRGNACVQIFYVYTGNPPATERALVEAWGKDQ